HCITVCISSCIPTAQLASPQRFACLEWPHPSPSAPRIGLDNADSQIVQDGRQSWRRHQLRDAGDLELDDRMIEHGKIGLSAEPGGIDDAVRLLRMIMKSD